MPGAGGGAGISGNAGTPAFGGAAGTPGFGGAPGGGGTGTGATSGTGATTGAGGGVNTGACQFSFEFSTKPAGGKYAPKNIGAVWIANAQGAFVKSLNVWAAKRIVHLVKWNAASAGNKVDAITAATSTNHGPHAATWDCTDVSKNPVPDGNYSVMVEFTEGDSAFLIFPPGPTLSVPFVKNGQAGSITPPDQQFFSAMKLSMQ